ncbi:MAG: hypothetical protein ACLU4J_07515 [Butyricimonas paravirosa]
MRLPIQYALTYPERYIRRYCVWIWYLFRSHV